MVVTANVKKYALKQGLFLIEPSGESFNITPQQVNQRNGKLP
jgi:hypothetical protein